MARILKHRDCKTKLIWKRYGRLFVIGYSHNQKVRTMWNVICDCGQEKIVAGNSMISGAVLSCGCLRKENFSKMINKHGHAKVGKATVEYTTWLDMKTRCFNKNKKQYKDYGGRGITICKEWVDSFEKFFEDMGKKPTGMTLDRIDNDKGYSKKNCRWATRKEQSNNLRNNIIIEYNGLKLTMGQWAEKVGLKRETLRGRIEKYNWPIEKALTTPLRGKNV